VYTSDIGAVEAVLVLAVKIDPPAVVHRVAKNLAGIDFEPVKARRGLVEESTDGNGSAPDLTLQNLTNRLGVHSFAHLLEFSCRWCLYPKYRFAVGEKP
jgi:hypothetical protein